MKKILTLIAISILLCSLTGLYAANPRIIGQLVQYADGSTPPPASLTMTTWFTERPAEVRDMASYPAQIQFITTPGPATYAIVNLACFATPWSTAGGEHLVMHIVDTLHGNVFVEATIVTTAGSNTITVTTPVFIPWQPATIPLAAINPVPANLATGVAINAALSWDTVATATSYDVYFGTTLPGTPNVNVLTPTWTPPIMANNTTYQWMVIPKNAAGSATGNATWSFTTIIAAPVAATSPVPADLATGIAINASLSWGAVATATSYDVYFGTTLPGTPNVNVLTPTWTPPTMANNTTYQWMVIAKSAGGSSTGNATWSFTTIIAAPLAATSSVPADLATGIAINASLSWGAVATATSYDVYFGTTLPGTPNVNVLTPTWTPPTMANNTTYQWMVIAKNAGGSSTGNATWSFTTIVALPLAAINPVPANLATGVLINSSLSWDPVATATSYDVFYGTTLPGTATAIVTSPTWTPPVMNYSTTYSWMVVPYNAAGAAVGNATWTFTTEPVPIIIPPAAINPVPANLATGVAINASLSWDPVTTATSYDVYFGTTLPGTPNANVLTPTWTPPTMANNTVYQWMVVPKNSAGSATGNATWSFTTIIAAPLAATSPVPADLATGIAINASLSWGAVATATSYDVYFGTSLPGTPNANVLTPTWTPPTMANNTVYQWMVIAKNAGGSSTGNATWSFTTIIAAPIAATTPVPANLATGIAINASLSWGAVPTATSYDVYFGTTLPGTPNVNVLTPTWTPPTMANNTVYHWMVIAKNAGGSSTGNATWSFTTIIAAPVAATSPVPANLATNVAINASLSWGTVATATSYDVYFGTTLPGTPNANVLTPTWTPPAMANNTVYQWMVIAKNAGGSSTGNATWSFTTIIAAPLAATSPVPANLATNIAINVLLSWGAVVTATSYDVYFGTTLPGTPNANVLTPTWTPPTMANNTTYQWMVIANNAGGSSTGNATWSFTTIVALPLAAINPVPANLATGVSISSSLSWGPVANATSYDVYFGTTLPGTPNANVLTSTWTPPVMNYSTGYSWMVIPMNAAGSAVGNATWTFTTQPVPIVPPLAAINPVPANLATGVLTNASLSWDPVATATSYDVFFGTTLPGTANANVSSPTWTPPAMAFGTTYQWMVVPMNSAGPATGNATWSFTTIIAAPLAATSPVPANLATGIAINASLSWGAVPTATSYDVYFGTTLPGTPNANVLTPTWTPPTMANNTTYQWMVIAKNAGGSSTGNATWSFTTIVALPLAAINPVPANLATGVSISSPLSWDPVANATSYDVYFGTTLPGTPNANVLTSTWTPPVMNYSTGYSWMVIPKNAAGSAVGNATWTFTTQPVPIVPPLAAINPVPANLATGVLTNASLSWDPVATATSYDVFFGTTLPGTANANVSSPTWTPPAMAFGTTYQWMVIPMNSAGPATGNATWSFTTVVPVVFNPPTNLVATAGINLVHITWLAPLVGTPSGYNIYRDTVLITPTPITALSFDDTNVTLLSTYTYTVTAVYTSPNGESVASNPSTAGPTENMPTPTGLTANVNVYEVTLSWSAPVRNDRMPLGYLLYRDNVLIATISNLATLSYIDNVGPGNYSYTIAESYTMGVSPMSAPVTANVVISPAPTGLTAVRSANSVSLTWNAIPGAASYNVYYAVRPDATGAGWILLTNASTNAFTDVNPSANRRFYSVTVVSP